MRRLPPDIWSQEPPENISKNLKTSQDGRVNCQSECPVYRSDRFLTRACQYRGNSVACWVTSRQKQHIRPCTKMTSLTSELSWTTMPRNPSRLLLLGMGQFKVRFSKCLILWPKRRLSISLLTRVMLCGPIMENISEAFVQSPRSTQLPMILIRGVSSITYNFLACCHFLACYVSSTPARNRIFFGEDRNGTYCQQPFGYVPTYNN